MDLTIVGTDFNGNSVDLGQPLSFSFHSLLTCPYDELTLTVFQRLERLKSIKVLVDGTTFFDGLVLTQVLEKKISSAVSLTCRSKPGYLMTENQINPYAYFQVSGESIVNDYAKPFGIVGVKLEENKSINIMLVSEKESYWDYLTQFFVQAYGKAPYVQRNNYIVLTPYTGNSYSLSPVGSLRYLDYSEHFHTKTVSKVYFYTGTDDFGSLYEESYQNPYAEEVGFQKELYLHPTRSWATEHQKYADYLFYKSMVDSRYLEVTLPGWHGFEPGDQVVFGREGGTSETLYIGEMRIAASESGITTVLRLWDPARHLLA